MRIGHSHAFPRYLKEQGLATISTARALNFINKAFKDTVILQVHVKIKKLDPL
jgi:hypothetical protein